MTLPFHYKIFMTNIPRKYNEHNNYKCIETKIEKESSKEFHFLSVTTQIGIWLKRGDTLTVIYILVCNMSIYMLVKPTDNTSRQILGFTFSRFFFQIYNYRKGLFTCKVFLYRAYILEVNIYCVKYGKNINTIA